MVENIRTAERLWHLLLDERRSPRNHREEAMEEGAVGKTIAGAPSLPLCRPLVHPSVGDKINWNFFKNSQSKARDRLISWWYFYFTGRSACGRYISKFNLVTLCRGESTNTVIFLCRVGVLERTLHANVPGPSEVFPGTILWFGIWSLWVQGCSLGLHSEWPCCAHGWSLRGSESHGTVAELRKEEAKGPLSHIFPMWIHTLPHTSESEY